MTARGEAAAAAALDVLLADPARTGLFTDFDGTLSPIVDDPDAARPLDGAADVLAALAARFGRVAVVSGRPAAFLLAQVGSPGLALWGLHGLETVMDGEVVAAAGVEPWRAVVALAVANARRAFPHHDVEDKSLALTLHYRRDPDAADRAREWALACAADTGLVVHPARMSYELRPPVRHGKDVVVEEVAGDLTAACFIGDDQGDAVAFDALDRLEAAHGLHAVRIAAASDEAPAALLERADLVVAGPPGVLRLLRDLAGA